MLLLSGKPAMLSDFREIQVFVACLSLLIGLSPSGYAALIGSWCVDCTLTMIWQAFMLSLLRRRASRGVLGVEGGVPHTLPMRASLNEMGVGLCVLVCAVVFSCSFAIFSARAFVLSIVLRCLVDIALRRLEVFCRSLVVSLSHGVSVLGVMCWLMLFVIWSIYSDPKNRFMKGKNFLVGQIVAQQTKVKA